MPSRLTCEEVSNCFIRSPEVINREICNRSVEYKRHWFDLVPQSNYRWGEGYSKTKYTFRGGKIPEDLTWKPVQEERAPGTEGPNDKGHDPCEYDAHLVTYGLEALQYGAFNTHVRTNKFCLDSMLHKWELKRQFSMMVDAFTRTTLGIFEKAHKMFYLSLSDIYIAQPNVNNFLNSRYTPNGLNDLPNIAGVPVSTLSMEHLRWLYRHLMHDVPQFGVGTTDGLPDFGLSTSPETIESLYAQSPEAFDVLKRQPDNRILDGFGFTYSREHFMMMGDMRANRYEETALGSGDLIEVHPEAFQNEFCGDSPFASEQYSWEAPYEISIVVLKPGSVVQVNIPAPDTMFAGGADFGPRNYVGDFRFIRPPADCGTEKRNFGWWFAEFFAEPEPGCARAVAIIHRRCLSDTIDLGACDPCPAEPCPDPLPALPGIVVVGGEPTQLDVDLTGSIYDPAGLPLDIGALVAFELQNGDFELGTVIDNASDPVHRFAFNVDATEYASAGSNPVVAIVDPNLSACGTVCNCFQDPAGAPEDINLQFEEKVINLGVGATIDVDFGDATSTTATISAIGGTTVWPTYTLTFGAPRECEDNDGIVTVGTCP